MQGLEGQARLLQGDPTQRANRPSAGAAGKSQLQCLQEAGHPGAKALLLPKLTAGKPS